MIRLSMITLHFMEDISVTFSNNALLYINDYFIYDNIIILHTFKFSETSVYLYKYTTFVKIT